MILKKISIILAFLISANGVNAATRATGATRGVNPADAVNSAIKTDGTATTPQSARSARRTPTTSRIKTVQSSTQQNESLAPTTSARNIASRSATPQTPNLSV